MPKGRWSLQDAKSQLSRVVDAARAGEAQVVTRHGKPAAVVLSFESYERLRGLESRAAPSFRDLLLAMPQEDGPQEDGPQEDGPQEDGGLEHMDVEPRPVEL